MNKQFISVEWLEMAAFNTGSQVVSRLTYCERRFWKVAFARIGGLLK